MATGAQVRFRPAAAADVGTAVPLIHSSGPAAFEYVFAVPGRNDAQAFLRHAFVDGAGEFGWRNHWVGELNGQVVAVGAGYGAEVQWDFTLAAARQILGFFGWRHAGAVIARGLRVERIIAPPKGDMHYLAHLGVDPAWQGRGIGQALIGHLAAEAARRGRSRLALDVAVSNPRAQALYERCGFVVLDEKPSALADARGHVPAHRRMERWSAG